MLIEMKINGLAMDPYTNMPIVILKDLELKQSLPIWIGILEASAIATELEHIVLSRPMTHDLLKNILDQLNVQVEQVQIVDLRDNTFYAKIKLLIDEQTIEIDARPSDSLALSLRTGAPIWVDSSVIENCRSIELSTETTEIDCEQHEKLAELLETLNDKDFGKYKM
ncbi:MAG: bifunctional nuclease family protein [Candidatus Alcyoniella australis]|nr:bifunctional nuclease family protein [Candidatus Alcyoniella australis]